jgi:hypothetical protein
MSHFTTIKTELRNLAAVEAALRRLGVEYERGGAIEDYYKSSLPVDLTVRLPGQRAVGFARNTASGVIELVGDWYGGSTSQEEFVTSLTHHYAREQVLESLEQQGVDLSRVKEREEPDGSVVFELPLEDDQMEAMIGG